MIRQSTGNECEVFDVQRNHEFVGLKDDGKSDMRGNAGRSPSFIFLASQKELLRETAQCSDWLRRLMLTQADCSDWSSPQDGWDLGSCRTVKLAALFRCTRTRTSILPIPTSVGKDGMCFVQRGLHPSIRRMKRADSLWGWN